MIEPHSAHSCRWGQPTLLLPWPFWYAASDDAWTCTCNGVPRILHDPDVCRTCRRWEPLEEKPATQPHAACEHHMALIYRQGADVDFPSVS